MTLSLKQPPLEHSHVPRAIWIIEAEAPGDFRFLEAADAGDATESAVAQLRRFVMTAYTGGKMLLAGFDFPVVVDLSGLKVSTKSRPILRDHDASRIVGHTESIDVNAGSLKLAGVISGSNDHAREVTASGDNGFPWQSSIGAIASRVVYVDQGESVEVNGRRFTGPLYVARQSSLREVSFVALGADDQTVTRLIAARDSSAGRSLSQPPQSLKAQSMEFEAWVRKQGFDPDDLNELQTASLQAIFSKPLEAGDGKPTASTEGAELNGSAEIQGSQPTPSSSPLQAAVSGLPPRSAIDELRAQWATERRRIAKIADLCAGEYPEIEARAVEEGWDQTRTELELLRVARPKAPAIHGAPAVASSRVLEAAVWMSAHVPEPECLREFGEQTLEAAHPLRQIGLKELVAECARLEGHHVPRVFGDGKVTIQAGFSTVSLPGILESVMNRTMLAAYEAAPIAAFQLCAIGSVSDFKEVSRYRLLGTGGFEKVSPTGELKSGTLSEQKYAQLA